MKPMKLYVKDVPEHCERLGKIPGDDAIFTGEDAQYSYKVYDELPSASTCIDEIIVLGAATGGFGKGAILRKMTNKYGDVEWVQLSDPENGCDVPTNIVSLKVQRDDVTGGGTVSVRWEDPADKDPIVWKKTVLVRKALTYPSSVNDGIVLVENRVRDYYKDKPFIDEQPPMIDTEWRYRLFACSMDGVYTSNTTTCTFIPEIFDWENMHNLISSGNIRHLLKVGDVLTYKTWSATIVDFDAVTPVDTNRYPHTINLVVNNAFTFSQYDAPWGEYYLVDGEFVAYAAQRNYYKLVNGKYVKTSVASGTTITASMGIYAKQTDKNAQLYGKTTWKTSKIRTKIKTNSDLMYSVLPQFFQNLIVDTITEEGVIDRTWIPTLDQITGDTAFEYFKMMTMKDIYGTKFPNQYFWTRTAENNMLKCISTKDNSVVLYPPKMQANANWFISIG